MPHHEGELCHDCGCHNHSAGIVKPALRHTGKIFLYLFVFTFILNLCIDILGIDKISAMMLGDTVFQPAIAALIGLIPNCAASVILTQLYLSGAISFSSVIAGLCTGAGIGLVVLFKVNPDSSIVCDCCDRRSDPGADRSVECCLWHRIAFLEECVIILTTR